MFWLSFLTSIGNAGFQAFCVTSLTIMKLIFLVVYSLARRVSSGVGFMFWFGVSLSLISWHEIFSVQDTRSDTSMVEVFCSLGLDCERR